MRALCQWQEGDERICSKIMVCERHRRRQEPCNDRFGLSDGTLKEVNTFNVITPTLFANTWRRVHHGATDIDKNASGNESRGLQLLYVVLDATILLLVLHCMLCSNCWLASLIRFFFSLLLCDFDLNFGALPTQAKRGTPEKLAVNYFVFRFSHLAGSGHRKTIDTHTHTYIKHVLWRQQ